MKAHVMLFALAGALLPAAPAFAVWMSGTPTEVRGVCTVMGGEYGMAKAQASYWIETAGATPKVGDVYYASGFVSNISPCSNIGVQPVMTPPPNTALAISAATPIRCFLTKFSVTPAITQEVFGADPNGNYICPSSPTAGLGHGSWGLGWAKVPSGWLFEVLVPVVSTAPLLGMASANDRFFVDSSVTGDAASMEVAWFGDKGAQSFVWTTVYANATAPSIVYPTPSSLQVTDTSARSLATLKSNFVTGSLFFDLGTTTSYGIVGGPYSVASAASTDWFQNWVQLTPGTTYHWRARFVPATGAPVLGADQTFTTTGSTTRSADVSTAISGSPEPATLGGEVTYLVSAKNSGPDDAPDVVVTGTLPAGLAFVSGSGCNASAGGFTCPLGTLFLGNQPLATVVVRANAAGSHTVGVSVTSGASDPRPANNSATVVTTVPGVANGADVSVTLTGPDTLAVGAEGTWRVVVRNAGPSSATGVKLSGLLSPGLEFVSPPAGCTASGRSLSCDLGTLAPSAESTFSLLARGLTAGAQTVEVTATATSTDPNAANDTAKASTTVQAAGSGADLSCTVTATPDPVSVGSVLTWNVTVKDRGPDPATGVTVTATLPSKVTVASLPSACTNASGTVTCTVGDLASGASRSLKLTARPTQTGKLTLKASVTGTSQDPDPANDSASVASNVTEPALEIGVRAGPHSPADGAATKGTSDVPLLQLQLDAPADREVSLDGLELQASGTGRDDVHVTQVKVWADDDGDGVHDAAEKLLGAGTYSADDGLLSLTFAEPLPIAVGASAQVLVAYDLSATLAARTGERGGGLGGGLAFLLFPMALGSVVVARGRRWAVLALVLITTGVGVACSGSSPEPTSADTGVASPRDAGTVGGPLTFQVTATGASLSQASGKPVTATGLPVAGATLTVAR